MKPKIKAALIALLGLVTVFSATGCGGETSPYKINDSEGYTVSVRFDANGGSFTTNTYSIVDSFNVNELEKNGSGNAEIALIEPDNAARGKDAFKPFKEDCFLAGWYKNREEKTDSNGNTYYTYSQKWDFEKDILEVDPNGEFYSGSPVLTLYAAWVPLFEIRFYSLDSGELLKTYSYDPTSTESIAVPKWSEESGALEMYSFPERKGFTFEKAYYDQNATESVDTETVIHPGKINLENGTAENHVLKLYTEWKEGEWFKIHTAKQFVNNATLSGNYEILADLDFSDVIWPTAFVYGNFTGTINGNGHTFKNVSAVQTNNSKVNAGLFGNVTESASISDITFENVTFTVQAGTRVAGTSYGLFAGTLSKDANVKNINILSSSLQIDSSCYFGTEDYSIGLICGIGNDTAIPNAEISCVAVGEEPEKLEITVNGNTVTVVFKE
ncbi:MAG: hypothetical protein IJB49_02610 [Clostridia bacterium]|nr:hypothetical protein [Clostridia bacterium]